MRYITHILLPGEDVLLNARVHPVLLLPGLLLILAGGWLMIWYNHSTHETYAIARFGRWLYHLDSSRSGFYALGKLIMQFGGSWGKDRNVLALILFFPGLRKVALALELIMFTELVVTNKRVIAKTGVITTTTIELDRRRITEVIVQQNLMGRILNYGSVYLQGFAGGISGLPVIARPYQLQRALTYSGAAI